MLWRLRRHLYGISEAKRQWMIAIEFWMKTSAQTERVPGVRQFYGRHDINKKFIMLIATATDDIFLSGWLDALQHFRDLVKSRFHIWKTIDGRKVSFNGCNITQTQRSRIVIDMSDYLQSIHYINIPRHRRMLLDKQTTRYELLCFSRLAGELFWLECATRSMRFVVIQKYSHKPHTSCLLYNRR